jgi:hypothetical protein
MRSMMVLCLYLPGKYPKINFRQLSRGKHALPSMAIATIKYDEHN